MVKQAIGIIQSEENGSDNFAARLKVFPVAKAADHAVRAAVPLYLLHAVAIAGLATTPGAAQQTGKFLTPQDQLVAIENPCIGDLNLPLSLDLDEPITLYPVKTSSKVFYSRNQQLPPCQLVQ
jgi:hypothetical protein